MGNRCKHRSTDVVQVRVDHTAGELVLVAEIECSDCGRYGTFAAPVEEAQTVWMGEEENAASDASSSCDCGGRGWLHMNNSMGRGPGVERCDDCKRFDTDEDASAEHANVCPCGMGVAEDGPEDEW